MAVARAQIGIGTINWKPSGRAAAMNSSAIRCQIVREKPTESILLIARTACRMPSAATMKACRLVCGSTPPRASIRMMARSAVDAPVAMLRVYCSWPGVSAMMKLRPLGREVAVGDVDGDALLPLGAKPVEQQREISVFAMRTPTSSNS